MNKKAYINAKIYVDKGHYEEALLVKGSKIAFVGTNEEILRAAGEDAEVYDCGGKTMVPGFNDSHMHLAFFGLKLIRPDLNSCKSVEDIIDVCRKYIADHPGLTGLKATGWNEDNFDPDKKRLPTRYDMDKISTEIPIRLSRVCNHVAALNSNLLEKMGMSEAPKDIDGGKVGVDENGVPNGLVYENASGLAELYIPVESPDQFRDGFIAGNNYAVAHGLTSVQSQCFDNDYAMADAEYEGIRDAYEKGLADIRWNCQVGIKSMEGAKRYAEGPHLYESDFDDHFNIGGFKMFKDGSLGARSALMRDDYADDPGNKGVTVISDEEQLEIVRYAEQHNIQVLTHVIGDGAIERTARVYAKAMEGRPNRNRHTLIHCQITDKEMLKYIADNDLVVSAQPVFLEYDLHAVDSRTPYGPTSYATKTANEMGIHISYGTDCPVEDCNPMCNIYCAVTRKDYNGFPEGGWNPQECVDVETAVDNYTAGSAYQEFRENVKGRLKPGYYADFVLLDKDIFTVDPMEILKTETLLTVIGGKEVYKK